MLPQFLNSINWDKDNIIRKGSSEVGERLYPAFPVLRSLSYHQDAIFLVQELNKLGTAGHNISNLQHYEFLLYSLSKRKRFAKWERPSTDGDVELLMEVFQFSREKANDALTILTEQQIVEIRQSREQGGKQ